MQSAGSTGKESELRHLLIRDLQLSIGVRHSVLNAVIDLRAAGVGQKGNSDARSRSGEGPCPHRAAASAPTGNGSWRLSLPVLLGLVGSLAMLTGGISCAGVLRVDPVLGDGPLSRWADRPRLTVGSGCCCCGPGRGERRPASCWATARRRPPSQAPGASITCRFATQHHPAGVPWHGIARWHRRRRGTAAPFPRSAPGGSRSRGLVPPAPRRRAPGAA